MTVKEFVMEWVEKADNNLISANTLYKYSYPKQLESTCFHAQQAIEMIFKAVLASQKLKIPRTHDLVFLSSLVFSNKKIDSNLLKTLKQLNAFAVDIRYPNDFIISLEETKLYLKEAEKIVKLVKENILGLGI